MSKMVPVFCKGKVIMLPKPITPKRTKERLESYSSANERLYDTKKYTFACYYTGVVVECTLREMEAAEKKVEDDYAFTEYGSWGDLWAEAGNNFIPALSLLGGYDRADIVMKGYDDSCGLCGLGWSKEAFRQFYEKDPSSMLLKFDNILLREKCFRYIFLSSL